MSLSNSIVVVIDLDLYLTLAFFFPLKFICIVQFGLCLSIVAHFENLYFFCIFSYYFNVEVLYQPQIHSPMHLSSLLENHYAI